MIVKLSIVLLVALIGCTSGAPRPDVRIVGGSPINITQVSWQAAILYNERFKCGATIISNRWILTAADCIKGIYRAFLRVRVGTANNEDTDAYKIESYIIHERYNGFDYNFALVKLTYDIGLNERVQAIQLPNVDDEAVEIGAKLLVSGWGNTANHNEPTKYLHAVEVPIVDVAFCNEAYGGQMTERMFCAGYHKDGGKGICYGDAGGPAAVFDGQTKKATLVGLAGWGRPCAQKAYPDVYSRVSAIRDWIRRQTRI